MNTNLALKDITKPKDIQRVVNAFFKKVKKDSLLSLYFANKTKEEWEAFLPLMCKFWENTLFYSGGYFGNPMQRHQEMNELHSFTRVHFDRWLELFNDAIDTRYAGVNAETMKDRARHIATIMQVKLEQHNKAG